MDAIIINNIVYTVVRTNNIAGFGPDPCSLCDKTVKRRCCQPYGYADLQPCKIFHRGHMLAHFKRESDDKNKK